MKILLLLLALIAGYEPELVVNEEEDISSIERFSLCVNRFDKMKRSELFWVCYEREDIQERIYR